MDSFLDSECELYDELQSFLINMPETIHFITLIEMKLLDTIFELLFHENTGNRCVDIDYIQFLDISVCGLQILFEMSDAEDLIKYENVWEAFLSSLVTECV